MEKRNLAEEVMGALPEGFGAVECHVPAGVSCRRKIGLVIPTYKRPDYLEQCLQALGKSDLRETVLCLVDESAAGRVRLFEDFLFHYGADQDGYDLERVEGSIDEIRRACERSKRCVAFNTNGWLKKKIKKLNYDYCDCYDFGLYVKSKGFSGFVYPNGRKKELEKTLNADVEKTTGLVRDFSAGIPVIKIFKKRHGNMYESLRVGWDLLMQLFDCEYLCCLDSDAIVKENWLSRLVEVDCLAREEGKERFVITTGFNCANKGTLETLDQYCVKDAVGSINLFFRREEYREVIRGTLDRIDWDWEVVKNCRDRNGCFICTRPSVVQHIGRTGLWSRERDYDVAADF